MNDNVLKALIRLSLCPKIRSNLDTCKNCPYSYKDGLSCSTQLRRDCERVLTKYCESGETAFKPEAPEVARPKDIRVVAATLIHYLGVPSHIKGYLYLRECVVLVSQDRRLLGAITKELYPRVARTFDSTPARVERAIRHAIEVAWSRCDIDVLAELFGNTVDLVKGKPTNSECIALLADKLHYEMEEK